MRRRDVNRLGLALMGLTAAQPSWAQDAQALTPDAYFDRLAAFGLSGGGFVIEDGRTVWSRAVGWADKRTLAAFDQRTVFNIASITKTMTALAVLSLVAEGKLGLTDTLGRFLPTAPDDKLGITLAQLLSHMSGLPRDVGRPRRPLDRDAMLAPILSSDLVTPPGAQFSYSNEGYRLLAAVTETVDGRSFHDAVRARVFERAGMVDSGFIQEPPTGRTVAQGYLAWGGLGDFRTLQRMGWNEGAGNIVSTLGDMARFAQALQDGRIISPDLLALAQSKQSVDAGTTGYEAYGYGWYIGALANGDPLIVHSGDNPGYHDELRWYPRARRWIFVVSTRDLYDDSGQGLGLHVRTIGSNLSRLRTNVAFESPPAAHALDRAAMQGLVGDYSTEDGLIRLTRVHPADPHLTALAHGQGAANALTGVSADHAGRLAKANVDSLTIGGMIAAQDRVGLTATPLLTFFAEGWLDSFDHWRTQFGPFVDLGPVTSARTPVSEEQIRTHLPFRFERGEAVLEFTWNGERLYETLTGTGAPSSVVLPVAEQPDGALVAWDMVTNARVTMKVGRRGLTIGDMTFQRV